ncbi:hypothetical protein JVT61DRAFT_5433 [Boletus reticuloceps]|uniref:Uncharacterized protein n=1 Tax=Boletus reticuloceps TaxID=495285 RepID=A0A8I2Z2D5_9AGAM|nr:hypothetical protein JVT61DRAFT_5433 [Boletus reticuloceps]
MSVAPSPSSSRGEIILQPAYFTSSSFVHPARADIDSLLQLYSHQYTPTTSHPFTLFKDIWQAQGWPWIQFKVFDARSRAAFLKVVMRLFSEHIRGGEPPLRRAAALFGLYTIFSTQPSISAPPLYSAAQIQVTWGTHAPQTLSPRVPDVTQDLYQDIEMLPDALDAEFLRPIRPHVVYVQSKLLQAQAFHILPRAETHPLNPRALPREVVVEDAEATTSTAQGRKKKGRPSRRERIKKARDSLVALDGWREDVLGSQPSVARGRYVMAKSAFMDAIGGDAAWEGTMRDANAMVVERMETITGLL